MTSPWVQRNLDNAQYAQPRGSLYEGPDLNPIRDMQDESIHREELDYMRAKNAHHAHYVLEGFRVEGCLFCHDIEREFSL